MLRPLLVALALAGCQPEAAPAPATPLAVPAPDPVEASTPAADTSAVPVTPGDWAGTYTFGEAIPGQGWDYVLTLRPGPGDTLVGTYDADGFQTHTRFDVRGDATGERVAVVLTGYRPENLFEQPAVGTRLFTLDRSSGETVTRWEGLEPNLTETPREGVAFVRSE